MKHFTLEEFVLLSSSAVLTLIFVIVLLVSVTNRDKLNNNTWDKCQQQFENSGAPMEARDSIMRDCFSK